MLQVAGFCPEASQVWDFNKKDLFPDLYKIVNPYWALITKNVPLRWSSGVFKILEL